MFRISSKFAETRPKPEQINAVPQAHPDRTPAEEIPKRAEGFPNTGRRTSEAGPKKRRKNRSKIPKKGRRHRGAVPNLFRWRVRQEAK